MKFLLLLLISCWYLISPAQRQTANWYFGDRAGVNFSCTTVGALTNGVMNTEEGTAVISDASGNLLFYTNGMSVWNRNHALMPNGTGLAGDLKSSQAALIVPRPGSTTRYFVFTVDMQAGQVLALDADGVYNGLRYSEVDMTANGGLGDILVANKNTPLLASSTEHLTAARHSNGTDYWVIAHGWNNNTYHAFLVTAAGVNPVSVQSNTGPVIDDVGSIQLQGFGAIGIMKASPDGTKLAASHPFAKQLVALSDFNPTTGVVSNTISLPILFGPTSEGPYGVEFSNCNEYLYVSEQFTTIGAFYASPEKTDIHRYDLNAANINASRIVFRTIDFQWVYSLQLALDGRIYCASMRRTFDPNTGVWLAFPNQSLHRINNPRLSTATFTLNAVGLGGRNCFIGLPSFIPSFFHETDFTITSSNADNTVFCLGDTAYFCISTLAYDSIRWNFGDPASGANNTSTLPNPKHYYAVEGIYTVKLYKYICNRVDSVIKTITIPPPPNATITPSGPTTFCPPGSVTLSAPPGMDAYQWFESGVPLGGQTNQSINVTSSGSYTVRVTLGQCSFTSTPTVVTTVASGSLTVTPAGPIDFCSGGSSTLTISTGGVSNIKWFRDNVEIPGQTSSTLSVNSQGSYYATADVGGCQGSSNTVVVNVNPSVPVSVSISPSANPVCTGTSVTFTATPVNGGASPNYQWFLNGNPVGSNSPTYTNATISNNDQVNVQLTSNVACPTGNPATSNTVTMTVSAAQPVSVSIAPSANPVCAGTSVTFTATPFNGGATPTYQWFLNGNPVGSNSPTYTNASLSNGDQVRVQLTSSLTCATGSPAQSNTVNMTVNPSSPVSVSISPSANPICSGTSVTFTATPTNGGASPSYQWLLNGNPVGSNSPTYTNASLSNGDQVSVQLTSNAACASNNPATSNVVTMTVSAAAVADVSISASDNPVCTGESVTFTATPVNGGATPTYQWFLNGNPVGSNSAVYTNASLADGDQVNVSMTSSASCVSGSPASSNTITMSVGGAIPVGVSISPSVNPICSGTTVTFTATPTNGGSSPTYQWFLNGGAVGSNSPTYSNSSLSNGDQVNVVMTSNSSCATGNPATSNTVTMDVNAALPVSVTISASDNNICTGTSVTFTATPTNGGATPSYQWFVNGNPVGSNSSTFTSASLNNGDQVNVSLTSSLSCGTGSPATSNTVTMNVSTASPVSVSASVSANPACSGDMLTFTATLVNGGSSPAYQWFLNGTPVGSNAPTYSYQYFDNGDQVWVQLTSSSSCASGNPATSAPVTMAINPLPVYDLGPDQQLCPGSQVVLDPGVANATYAWSTGESTPSITVSTSGTYSVSVTQNGCTAFDQVTLNFDATAPVPVFLGNDTTICEGDVIILNTGNQQNVSYLWQDGSSANTYTVTGDGLYSVTVSNDCGSVSASRQVFTDPCEVCGVYVPSAFSPNGDGINDTFAPISTCDEVPQYRFSVYNRWNERVFDTIVPGFGWDGTYKGQPQPLDSYIYFVTYYDTRLEKTVSYNGVVTLLR